MIRAQRLLFYILFIAFFVFFSISVFPRLKPTSSPAINSPYAPQQPPSAHSSPPRKAVPNEEKYLSWFPHSDFPEQQECFRNGIRLALETNRTIIAPMLRINKSYPWMPFEDLAKRYEAQDKKILRDLCSSNQRNWRTELEPCETIDEWTEIPWSSIMDLEAIKKDYGVRIIERTQGHGWGVHESALPEGSVRPEDVAVVDVMTFKENGTDWEHVDPAMEALKKKSDGSMYRWVQNYFLSKQQNDEKPKEPFKFVLYDNQLRAIDAKVIQFGALSSAARYATPPTEIQMSLRKAMMKTHFNVPDQMQKMTEQANKIVSALGGRFEYSTLILNLAKLVALDARAGTIQHLDVDGKAPQSDMAAPKSMNELSKQAKKDLMDALVLEIFGDIPINQAVSAAMPIKRSKLSEFLGNGRPFPITDPVQRRELLDACVDYHKHVERRYPIYYLISDMDVAPESQPDIFGPLLDMFPCIFSKQDMLNWGIQTEDWSKGQPGLVDGVSYEKLFQPLLDILIAGKGYSFFEIPTTPLTRFLNWSPKA